MKVDLGRGAPTYIALRNDNGVTIHQGPSRIHLGPDELAAVLNAIRVVTNQGSRKPAEKTTTVGHV